MKVSKQDVKYIDHMGTDKTVVNAARVSFNADANSTEFDVIKDSRLINYLAKHGHWSPFAHTSIQIKVKAPIFVARQLVKHQVGGVWNEVSRRYVDYSPEFFFPDVWRSRPSASIKQGSGDSLDYDDVSIKECVYSIAKIYDKMLEDGIAPEQARMILPQNMMTEWYWTGSLMFWSRVCAQRLDSHAQQETQEIARHIYHICANMFPVSWKALQLNTNPQNSLPQ